MPMTPHWLSICHLSCEQRQLQSNPAALQCLCKTMAQPWLTLPLPLQRGQGAPAREPLISSEEHKQLMLFYHRRQEELKVAIGQQGWQQIWATSCIRCSPTGGGPVPSSLCSAGEGLSGSPRLSPALGHRVGVPLLAGFRLGGRKWPELFPQVLP